MRALSRASATLVAQRVVDRLVRTLMVASGPSPVRQGDAVIMSLSSPGATKVDILDESVLRGNGVFEVVGVADGILVGARLHLLRLLRSLHLNDIDLGHVAHSALGLDLPADKSAEDVVDQLLSRLLELARWEEPMRWGALRILVTRGSPSHPVPEVILVRHEGPPSEGGLEAMRPLTLAAIPAPWHPSCGMDWFGVGDDGRYGMPSAGATSTKWLSYAPNMAATRAAQRMGADDALLVAPVLSRPQDAKNTAGSDARFSMEAVEGPTFGLGWLARCSQRWHTPAPGELAVLPSVTMTVASSACLQAGDDALSFRSRHARFVPGTVDAADVPGDASPRLHGSRYIDDALLHGGSPYMFGAADPGLPRGFVSTLVGSTSLFAASATKHVSPVARVVVHRSLLDDMQPGGPLHYGDTADLAAADTTTEGDLVTFHFDTEPVRRVALEYARACRECCPRV